MDRNAQLADEALKNRLYVSGWVLSGVLKDIRDGLTNNHEVVLHRVDGRAVGVAVGVEWKCWDGPNKVNTMVFVKKAYRRNGIGGKLVRKLLKGREGTCEVGIIESEFFWKKNGLTIRN